jgi:hypothetical protein
MDFADSLKTAGLSTSFIAILGIAIKVLQSFCGHRLRSECCGREATVGVNVEDMSPRIKRESIQAVPPAPTAPAERAVCIDVEGKEVIKTEIKSV